MPTQEQPKLQPAFECRASTFSKTVEWLAGVASRHRFLVGCAIAVISSLYLIRFHDFREQGDTPLYQSIAADLLNGVLPYRNFVMGYPPYAIPIFVMPRICGDGYYLSIFVGTAFVVDCLIKLILLVCGLRSTKTLRGLLPVLIYSLAVPFMHYFYLLRYDVWPTLISLAAIGLFSSGRYFLCGYAIAAGMGVKLYPVVFLPPLFVLSVRQGMGWRFASGVTIGLLPIILLSFFLPWWHFAQFQGERGLQVESLYGGLIWLGGQLHLTKVEWVSVESWSEVHGPLTSTILPVARGLFLVTVGLSTAAVTWAAMCCKKPAMAGLARWLLVPLLAFVAFNVVLSPQYMIWIMALAALASLEGNSRPMLALTFATLLTPIIFPSFFGHYGTGWKLPDTAVVVLRNFILVGVWAQLLRELFQAARQNRKCKSEERK
jgi:hypothetical protein